MTMETRKNLSVAAWMASAVCALFLVVSALAAASHQPHQAPAAWLDTEIHAPR
jgi:hypothetical protein